MPHAAMYAPKYRAPRRRNRLVILLLAFAAFWLTLPSAAQQRSLKVMLLYDMEGVSGVSDYKQTSFVHSSEYAEGRRSLTADVNAAIAGLKAAGATEIVVVDGHGSGTGPDVLEDQLLSPASMHYQDTPFDIYMDSYDPSFDAIVAVAMHAGAGNRAGFLSHTYTTHDVEYKVNGVPFNESMILAMGAARLKIPLIMVSGDDQLEKEIHRNLPWVEYASVKHAEDRAKAESFGREEASRRIEAAARQGLEKLAQARLPDFAGPYRFALTFQDTQQAQAAALLAGAELLPNNVSVQIRSQDFEEGYRRTLRLIQLAAGPARNAALQDILNAGGNTPGTSLQVTDEIYGRFLNTLSPPHAPAPPARRRYWGAQ